MNKDVKYHSVSELAKLWEMSERTIRNYCAMGGIGTWLIGHNNP